LRAWFDAPRNKVFENRLKAGLEVDMAERMTTHDTDFADEGLSGGLSWRRRPVPDVLNVPGKEVPYGRAVVAERGQWLVDCEYPEGDNLVLHKLERRPNAQRVNDE
jgi:hypothetical protein